MGVPRPADLPRPKSHPWLACAVLAAGTMLLFSRSLGYGFINYDDPTHLTRERLQKIRP